MTNLSPLVVFLSGAGGGTPDFSVFRYGAEDATRFEIIPYPNWERYVSDGFSAEVLIADLVEEIAKRVPQGPIRIIGLSIGGHFGYGAAIRLEAIGREVAGFCAIDTFMIASSKPSEGWKRRAFAQGLELLRGRRFGEFMLFLRSKFWRGLLRLVGGRLPSLLQGLSTSGGLPLGIDSIFEGELNMRLLIREAAPWIASLDRAPVPLKAPAVLLRTGPASNDELSWRRRCPDIKIYEIPGRHDTLFEAENIANLREVFITATRDWR
jgi:thioesterase domain-containing protein